MAEHPIDKRAMRKCIGWMDQRAALGFTEGARFGYNEALSDTKKRLAAAESCVEYLRTLADANDFPTASKKLVRAYDDAVKEAE